MTKNIQQNNIPEVLFRAKKKEMKPENEHYCPNGWVFGQTLFQATADEPVNDTVNNKDDTVSFPEEFYILPHGVSAEAYYKGKYEFRANDVVFEVMLSKIDETTLCRYTNKKDKDGNYIFSGDIVEGTIVSQWGKAKIQCLVIDKGSVFECQNIKHGSTHKLMFAKDIHVVGNIWDTPELLGETNE